jgi:hypothetical protein
MTKSLNKIRFFSGFHQDFAVLENEINQWLAEHADIQIIHMTQCEMSSEPGRDIVVTLLFKESPDS